MSETNFACSLQPPPNLHPKMPIPRRTFCTAVAVAMAYDFGCTGNMRGWARSDDRDPLQGYEFSFPSMGSIIHVRWFSDDEGISRRIGELCVRTADAWVEVLSDYQQDSEVMRVCASAQKEIWTDTSPMLWEMIEACNRWHTISQGAFDASLGAMTSARRKRKGNILEDLELARDQCGWEFVELDHPNRRVRFHRPKLRLDFGAIGKGFVADKIGAMMTAHGIPCVNVNAAGNMHLGQSPPTQSDEQAPDRGWPISIPSLRDDEIDFCRLRLAQCGIATSGNRWQRFPTLNDVDAPVKTPRSTSHILDPHSLQGLDGDQSVSVIADNAADADAAATASCVRLRQDPAAWFERLEQFVPKVRLLSQSRSSPSAPIQSLHNGFFR